jgi:hypothetical protein
VLRLDDDLISELLERGEADSSASLRNDNKGTGNGKSNGNGSNYNCNRKCGILPFDCAQGQSDSGVRCNDSDVRFGGGCSGGG